MTSSAAQVQRDRAAAGTTMPPSSPTAATAVNSTVAVRAEVVELPLELARDRADLDVRLGTVASTSLSVCQDSTNRNTTIASG